MAATTMFGPLDAVLYDYVEYVLLGLVLLNGATRLLGHRRYVGQYREEGADGITRFAPHQVMNVLLLLVAFYYTTVSYVAGTLLSVIVVAVIVSDVFEFEARLAEARTDEPLDRPKGALAAWSVAAFYVAYRALFFVVEPLWRSVFV